MTDLKEKIEQIKLEQPESVERGKRVIEELMKQYPFLKTGDLPIKLLYTYVKYGNELLETVQHSLELVPKIAPEPMKLMLVRGTVDSYVNKEGLIRKVTVIYTSNINQTSQLDANGAPKRIRNFSVFHEGKVYNIVISGDQIDRYKVTTGKLYNMSLNKMDDGRMYAVDNGICQEDGIQQVNWMEIAEAVLSSYPKLHFPFDAAVASKKDHALLGMIRVLNPKFALVKFAEESGNEYTLGMPNPPAVAKDGDPVVIVGGLVKSQNDNQSNQSIQVDYVIFPRLLISLNPTIPKTPSNTNQSEMSKEDVKKIFGGS